MLVSGSAAEFPDLEEVKVSLFVVAESETQGFRFKLGVLGAQDFLFQLSLHCAQGIFFQVGVEGVRGFLFQGIVHEAFSFN